MGSSTVLAVMEMLRHMENGRFVDAIRALRRHQLDHRRPPPPHALARLGAIMLEMGRPGDAELPLRLFLRHYKSNLDRHEVVRNLGRTLEVIGQEEEAHALATEALKLESKHEKRLHRQAKLDRALAGLD